jgi:hypothetical protein
VCQAADFNPDPESASYKTMLAWYWSYLLRIGSLIDSFIFVAQKKFNRVTKIHTATYSMGIIFTWIHTRYVPTGTETIDIMLILFNHAFAYIYFMLSSMGSDIRPYLWWKQHFTTFQAAQGPPLPIINCLMLCFFNVERKCII